jgi:hypothetical protein
MKQIVQLDGDGYFVGLTEADESPLEPGVFLFPAGTIDVIPPVVPEGKRAKWDGVWSFEDLPPPLHPPPPLPSPPDPEPTYKEKRAEEYPSIGDYLDGIVKNDQAQIAKYIADCLAVKAKYPKPE